MAATEPSTSNELQAEAFKQLYPEQYYARFINSNLRPDGRSLSSARATSIGINPIGTADSSVLVKTGETTAMAGIKLGISALEGEPALESLLAVSIEVAAFSSSEARPGRPSLAAQCAQQQVKDALLSGCISTEQLLLKEGQAWKLFLDIYVLDADGAIFDVCLLAAQAALLALRLPSAEINEDGKVVTTADIKQEDIKQEEQRLLRLSYVPMATSCALYEGRLILDPDAEEEVLAASTVTSVVDERGRLIGLLKAGGSAAANARTLQQCIQAAAARHKELSTVLSQSLQAAGLPSQHR